MEQDHERSWKCQFITNSYHLPYIIKTISDLLTTQNTSDYIQEYYLCKVLVKHTYKVWEMQGKLSC